MWNDEIYPQILKCGMMEYTLPPNPKMWNDEIYPQILKHGMAEYTPKS